MRMYRHMHIVYLKPAVRQAGGFSAEIRVYFFGTVCTYRKCVIVGGFYSVPPVLATTVLVMVNGENVVLSPALS